MWNFDTPATRTICIQYFHCTLSRNSAGVCSGFVSSLAYSGRRAGISTFDIIHLPLLRTREPCVARKERTSWWSTTCSYVAQRGQEAGGSKSRYYCTLSPVPFFCLSVSNVKVREWLWMTLEWFLNMWSLRFQRLFPQVCHKDPTKIQSNTVSSLGENQIQCLKEN